MFYIQFALNMDAVGGGLPKVDSNAKQKVRFNDMQR